MSGNGHIQSKPQDFRGVLREKAINHSLYYAGSQPTMEPVGAAAAAAVVETLETPECIRGGSAHLRAPRTARASLHALPSVSELRSRYESVTSMQYLRPPRTPSPDDDITYSDDDERVAVRRRSRDLSDDSAIEVEPRPRRHSHPREVTPPPEDAPGAAAPTPHQDRTLIEEHVVELGRRRSSDGVEIRGRCVRVPSVVVSDYSDGGSTVGPTHDEIEWLRSKWLGADSACSSTSTLSSREDEHYDPPPPVTPKRVSFP